MIRHVDLQRRRTLQRGVAFACAASGCVAWAAERVITVRIAQRRIQTAGTTIRVMTGDTVELRWISDEATTIHVHGYDITLPLIAMVETPMRFAVDATGRYPISAHGFGTGKNASHREVVLLYLEVHPR